MVWWFAAWRVFGQAKLEGGDHTFSESVLTLFLFHRGNKCLKINIGNKKPLCILSGPQMVEEKALEPFVSFAGCSC